MKKPLIIPLVVSFLLIGSMLRAQENVLTFGFQLKPIIPSNFFRSGTQIIHENNITYTIDQKPGYAFGMVARRGITRVLSFESGINYVKRNYNLALSVPDSGFSDTSRFSIIGYEIPVLGLLYIQLGEQVFMNTAFGFSVDLFPSDVGSRDDYFNHISIRRSWIKPSLLANLGFEYRTKKIGIFYLGASFHRPFTPMYKTKVEYIHPNNSREKIYADLSGNYLTFDLRYFFHEEPQKK